MSNGRADVFFGCLFILFLVITELVTVLGVHQTLNHLFSSDQMLFPV